jgi:cobyrinic acid a,c-diamide synthase
MGSLRLAVARDEAFCFYYRENFRELERLGFETVFFSPLRGEKLPDGCTGLYIGGGYPELHAKRLEENRGLKVDIKMKASEGLPIVAECGGYMYLTGSVGVDAVDINNKAGLSGVESAERTGGAGSFEMCGVIDAVCTKRERLVRFGYVEIADKTGCWMPEGERIRGHEFHYYDSTDNGSGALVSRASNGSAYSEIHVDETMWAGWPHLYFRSCAGFTRSFAEKCKKYGAK